MVFTKYAAEKAEAQPDTRRDSGKIHGKMLIYREKMEELCSGKKLNKKEIFDKKHNVFMSLF